MANTKRQDILNKIKEIIEAVQLDGLTLFNSVKTTRMPPSDIETTAFPVCYVYSDRETLLVEGEKAVIGQETYDWFIMLEVWASDTEMEDILQVIHNAMAANYKFSNLASFSERLGVDFMIVDPSTQLTAMLIPYHIVYRHSFGAM